MSGEKQEKQVDLDAVKPIESISIDLNKFDKKETEIAECIVLQVPSKFIDKEKNPMGLQWSLKVISKTVETVETGDEKIEFVASELFNLVQDEKGELKGFPTGKDSNLMKFMADLRIKDPEKMPSLKEVVKAMIGKKCLIKCYDKTIDGKKKTFMKFRY